MPSIKMSPSITVPIALDTLAETIWRLPQHERETFEDILEKKFVRAVLQRARQIPHLKKTGKLLSLAQLTQEFVA